MPKRIAVTSLNASTMDILNVIRKNANAEYRNDVPAVEQTTDIPKVGEVIYGTPAHANTFINALINRIALVRVQSATFNNPYARLKKGYLQYGETVEEIFVNIAKVMDFNPDKAEAREFKRYIPDVKSAFHIMNWKVLYPVMVSEDDLKMAFLSIDGVQDLIGRIVDSVYTAAEYDEFLLFKYMIIKEISKGHMHPVSIGPATKGNLDTAAIQFRGMSNLIPFFATEYNEAGVKNNTPKSRQVIFMDAMFNAQYDVEVLAGAFNMDKADFMGSLYLIDDWTSFDNARWDYLRKESTWVEEVTAEELSLMSGVKAVLVDEEWFQVYDNNNRFKERDVASGDYWNYFYHVWKTVSHSPFSNAIVFVTDTAPIELPESFSVTLTSKLQSPEAFTFTLGYDDSVPSFVPQQVDFIQTQPLTVAGIAVQDYGAVIIPVSQVATDITLEAEINGVRYKAGTAFTSASDVGQKLTFTPVAVAAVAGETRSAKK